ncbi:MAG: hypothetical protein ACRDOD_15310 [Streptosporangiaceae bacterium]
MTVIAAIAGFAAWLGAAVIVLGDGRRALAVGVAVAAAGLAGVTWQEGGVVAAELVLASGVIAALQRSRAGPEGWLIMPPGSTPRLILCVAGGLVALWFAASVTTGPDGPSRFAVLGVLGLCGARVISSRAPSTMVSALATVALAIAVATQLHGGAQGVAPYVVAALIAAGVMFMPMPAASAS